MAGGTRPRGPGDAKRGRLGRFLAIAVLLHLPLTPVGALVGLLSLFHPLERETPPEHLNAIPVSLLSPEEMAALGMSQPPAAPSPPPATAEAKEASAEMTVPAEPPKPKPKPRPKPKPKPEAADGGVAEVPDAARAPRPEKPLESPDGGAKAPPAERPTPAREDPMALVGKATTVADPNANVKLLLLNDRIRALPIGPRIGQLVARLPQWRSFFGPSGIDPIRDIDRVYVAGPQFRVSADVVAVVEYAIPPAQMRKAVDAIVNREPKGEWLPSKVPAARARADRAERIFVLPKGRIALMVPPHLKDDAIDKAPHLGFPSVPGKAAVVAFLATPWRALAGLPVQIQIPRSIASASLSVTPAEDGGAILHVEAVDESPDAAKSDADLLTRAINVLTQRDVGALGALIFGGQTLSLIEPVKLAADGKVIRGDARITPRQLDRIIGFAESWVDAVTGVPSRPPLGPQGPAPRPAAPRAPVPRAAPSAVP